MTLYFKSLGIENNSPVITSYNPNNDIHEIHQTLNEILISKTISPNTSHSQIKKRLCVTAIIPGYKGTYRPEGIIFQTEIKPDFVVPFDIITLTPSDKFTSKQFEKQMLKESEFFIFPDIESMQEKFPTSKIAIKTLNEFREKHNLSKINENKMSYNECCFHDEIKIQPIALIGTNQIFQKIGKEFKIPVYKTIEDWQKQQ